VTGNEAIAWSSISEPENQRLPRPSSDADEFSNFPERALTAAARMAPAELLGVIKNTPGYTHLPPDWMLDRFGIGPLPVLAKYLNQIETLTNDEEETMERISRTCEVKNWFCMEK
jgi:hypothetical protein